MQKFCIQATNETPAQHLEPVSHRPGKIPA
jgi:hypothetical protein